ncbi:MAG TPA: phosphate signaling complex protein PhoU, partial [Anaerolineaceae bacterium]|nr:phosphate signaling complex protein PhoU [Anaerolineaceae bacterium]
MASRDRLTQQVSHLQDEILLLGQMVEQATQKAMDSLRTRDTRLAREVYEHDLQINEKRFAIENAILILFATQQPMARDLRQLAAMLEVSTELERMGDYAKGIAKVTLRLGTFDIPIPMQELDDMARLSMTMLQKSLQAFVDGDHRLAMTIPQQDNEVDQLYNQVHHKLIETMIANPETIDQVNLLMWVAHNLERAADR